MKVENLAWKRKVVKTMLPGIQWLKEIKKKCFCRGKHENSSIKLGECLNYQCILLIMAANCEL